MQRKILSESFYAKPHEIVAFLSYRVPMELLLSNGLSTQSEGLSTKPEGLSTKEESLSTMGLDAKSLQGGLSEELRNRISEPGLRGKPDQILDLVVKLCEAKDFSAEELAVILGRDRKYVMNNYVRPLLQQKRIFYTIPDQPRHLAQRYRAGK